MKAHTSKWQIYPDEVFYAKDLLPARVTISFHFCLGEHISDHGRYINQSYVHTFQIDGLNLIYELDLSLTCSFCQTLIWNFLDYPVCWQYIFNISYMYYINFLACGIFHFYSLSFYRDHSVVFYIARIKWLASIILY